MDSEVKRQTPAQPGGNAVTGWVDLGDTPRLAGVGRRTLGAASACEHIWMAPPRGEAAPSAGAARQGDATARRRHDTRLDRRKPVSRRKRAPHRQEMSTQ